MNSYYMELEERNGEQEYSYEYLIYAKDIYEAWEMAKEKARTWYDDEDVELTETGEYEFFGGSLVARITEVCPMTEREFTEMMLNRYSINRPVGR